MSKASKPEWNTHSHFDNNLVKNCISELRNLECIQSFLVFTVEKYDIKRERWTDVPSMTCPRSNFAVTVLEDTIYVIGGFNGERTQVTPELQTLA